MRFAQRSGYKSMRKFEKPNARGPTPREKATRTLGQKLNRKFKPPPDPRVLDPKPQSAGTSEEN